MAVSESNYLENQILINKKDSNSYTKPKKGKRCSSTTPKIKQIKARKDHLIALQGSSLVSSKSTPYSLKISSPRKSLGYFSPA